MAVGEFQQFTSTISGGASPYTYQWYLNSVAVSGANSASWTFRPNSPGSYNVYVNVTDNVGFIAKSNVASVTVNPPPSVTVSPSSVVMDVGQSQQFTSTVTGGISPYTYQWYLDGASVSSATSASWTFTPSTPGSYAVYLNVTDAVSAVGTSNTATATVSGAPSPVPSATSTTTISDNSATVDQSATTGVSITVSGSSLQDGAQLNVTSTNYGDNQPEGTGAVPVDAAVFYAVNVISNGGALSSDVSGTLNMSDPSFNSASVIEYWDGTTWTSVATTFTAPDTVSCIIGAISASAHEAIPASALAGTPILVGTPKSSASTLTLSATSLAIITAIVVAIVVVFGLTFVYMRKRKAKQTTLAEH
jgi:hypothetical protein